MEFLDKEECIINFKYIAQVWEKVVGGKFDGDQQLVGGTSAFFLLGLS